MAGRDIAEIYSLSDPETGVVRYIGKAKNSQERYKQHLRLNRATPVYAWIDSLARRGMKPVLTVIMSTWSWEDSERAAIAQYREEQPDLLNVSPGGNQPTRSDDPLKRRVWELKRSLSIALRRGHLPESVKAKMRLAAFKRPELFREWRAI